MSRGRLSPAETLKQEPTPPSETLRWCVGPKQCPSRDTGVGEDATESFLSPDRHFALVWREEGGTAVLAVYDVQSLQQISRIVVNEAIVARVLAASVQWAFGNHILLTWSEGTNAESGYVYDLKGTELLNVSASAFTVSPSSRYLATYPTLLADAPVIEVYDLTSGRRVARKAASAEDGWVVQDIDWHGQQLQVRYRDTKGQVHEWSTSLDAQP